MKYYKILKNGRSCYGGKAKWHLPSKGKAGKWMPEVKGRLRRCSNGYHIIKPEHVGSWFIGGLQVFEVEPKGRVAYGFEKGVCRSARLIGEVEFVNGRLVPKKDPTKGKR